jgi:hypothetical protein
LLGAQCFKLVQIADIAIWGIVAKKPQKATLLTLLFDFIRD